MRLSQKELASLGGSDQTHISHIENNVVTSSTKILSNVTHTLDMTLS